MKKLFVEVTEEIQGPFGDKGVFKQVVYIHGLDHYPTKDSIFLGSNLSQQKTPGLYEMELNYRRDKYGNLAFGYEAGAPAPASSKKDAA